MLNIFNKNMQNKRKTIWLHFIFTKNNNNKKNVHVLPKMVQTKS